MKCEAARTAVMIWRDVANATAERRSWRKYNTGDGKRERGRVIRRVECDGRNGGVNDVDKCKKKSRCRDGFCTGPGSRMRRGAKAERYLEGGFLKAESGEGLRGKARARRSFFASRRRAGIYERTRRLVGRTGYASSGALQKAGLCWGGCWGRARPVKRSRKKIHLAE